MVGACFVDFAYEEDAIDDCAFETETVVLAVEDGYIGGRACRRVVSACGKRGVGLVVLG